MRRIPASEADAGLLLTGSGGSDQITKAARTTSRSPIQYANNLYAAMLVPGRRIFDTTVMRCGSTKTTSTTLLVYEDWR